MDAKQIGELYGRMVGSLGKQEDEFQRGSWKTVLGGYAYADLDAACRRWIADTFIEEWTQKPRGSRMPQPAELKASIENFNRSANRRFAPCSNCHDGWVYVTERTVRRCDCFHQWASEVRR